MPNKNDLPQAQEEVQEEVPSWLIDEENEGFDEVTDDQGFQELRVCTKMSRVFEDGEVELGHIYNAETKEDLGPARNLLIFKYRRVFQMSNEKGNSILCKSYDKEVGNVRVYNDENFDEEAIDKLGVTASELNDEDISIVNRQCEGCPCHPYDGWETIDGENIPPRCSVSHELYVLDLTEGFDKIPYLIRINQNSRLKKKVVKDLNSLLSRKLRLKNVPLYGGVFEFGSQKMKNSMGGKNLVWDIQFDSYVKMKEVVNFAKQSLKEFNKEEQRRKKETRKRMNNDEDVIETGAEEQEGNPWDGDEGNEETTEDDGNTPWG